MTSSWWRLTWRCGPITGRLDLISRRKGFCRRGKMLNWRDSSCQTFQHEKSCSLGGLQATQASVLQSLHWHSSAKCVIINSLFHPSCFQLDPLKPSQGHSYYYSHMLTSLKLAGNTQNMYLCFFLSFICAFFLIWFLCQVGSNKVPTHAGNQALCFLTAENTLYRYIIVISVLVWKSMNKFSFIWVQLVIRYLLEHQASF